MTINYNPVPVDYSDEELKTIVEDFIVAQRSEFSYKGICRHILQKAMNEGRTVDSRNTQYESNELKASDGIRVSSILWDLIFEREIIMAFGDNPYQSLPSGTDTRFVKRNVK